MISAALCLVATAGGTMANTLTCTVTAGDAAISQRLCDAVASQLTTQAEGQFDLVVTQARPTHIQARLSQTVAQQRREGPELTTSIIDRDSFPDHAISRFAASLVASLTAPN